MNTVEILILALALSLDAMIVSFSYGLIIKAGRFKNAIMLSLSFGFFQFLMPIIGWNFTSVVYNYLKIYSKWIVFAVFVGLAIKFIKEAYTKKEEQNIQCIGYMCMLGLAVATSIDAFGAGISLRFLNINSVIPSVIIGIVTFCLSLTGFYTASIFNKIPKKAVAILSAILLIYLAIKSVV